MEESCMTAAEDPEQFAHPRLKSRPVPRQELRRMLVNQSEPGCVILIGIADINVTLGNQLLDRTDDLGLVFRRKSLLR